MKSTGLKFAIALIIFGIAFTSCNEENSPSPRPDDETIPIDENSAFNMTNFIASFEQMFVASLRWAWDFSHDYSSGKAVSTFQNYKVFGKFGSGIFEITHAYNADGVITSSTRTSKLYLDEIVTFTYEYDLEGYIVKLTKTMYGEVEDIVDMEYDQDGQLIKKTHHALDADDKVWNEVFSYNSDGHVASYIDSKRDRRIEYSYSGGNMVEAKYYSNGELSDVEKYEYDGTGRLTKYFEVDDDYYTNISYTSDLMTQSVYYGGLLRYKTEIGEGFTTRKSYNYEYDDTGNFMYCTTREEDDNGKTKRKEYYEGSPESLQLVGYTIIDSRDPSSSKKTMESVYNASDLKLYYVVYTVSGGDIIESSWFTAGGSFINPEIIPERWIFELIK